MVREPRRTDLRPKMSDKRPYTGCSAVEVSMYAVPTHDEMAASLNTRPRVGRAVVTLEVSSSSPILRLTLSAPTENRRERNSNRRR